MPKKRAGAQTRLEPRKIRVCALLKCSTRINFCGGSKSIQKIHSVVTHTHTHGSLSCLPYVGYVDDDDDSDCGCSCDRWEINAPNLFDTQDVRILLRLLLLLFTFTCPALCSNEKRQIVVAVVVVVIVAVAAVVSSPRAVFARQTQQTRVISVVFSVYQWQQLKVAVECLKTWRRQSATILDVI